MESLKWSVVPNTSVNGIAFGTGRTAVRQQLGKPKRSFRKTPDAVNTTDAYKGFHVYYSSGDFLEAIEFFDKSITLSIFSQVVFPGKVSDSRRILTDLDGDNDSYVSKAYSVGIGSDGEDIVSILVGCRHYYE